MSDTNEASVLSVVTDPHLKQLKWPFDEEKEQVRRTKDGYPQLATVLKHFLAFTITFFNVLNVCTVH